MGVKPGTDSQEGHRDGLIKLKCLTKVTGPGSHSLALWALSLLKPQLGCERLSPTEGTVQTGTPLPEQTAMHHCWRGSGRDMNSVTSSLLRPSPVDSGAEQETELELQTIWLPHPHFRNDKVDTSFSISLNSRPFAVLPPPSYPTPAPAYPHQCLLGNGMAVCSDYRIIWW